MSIKGSLQQLPFPEFVQTLANLGRTGKLTLSRFGERGTVFLRNGRIIGAASSSVRETLGSLLVSQRLITEQQLLSAVDVQGDSSGSRRLGAILLEQGALSEDDLQQAVIRQTQRVVVELMRWKHGFFEFEPLELVDEKEIEVDILEVLLGEGLSAERVLLESAIALDEESVSNVQDVEDDEAAEAAGATAIPGSVESLRDLLREIRSPEFTGELTLRIRDYCSEMLARCVLFSIEGGHFRGMSHLGKESRSESEVDVFRELRIPVGEPSILADAAARHEAIRGTLPDEPGNRELIEGLGGDAPREAVAIPLVVEDRVVMVLYGDSGAEETPIDSIAELELIMLQTGLVMERNLGAQRRTEAEPGPAAAELELHSEDFRSLLDADPEPIVLLNPGCRILYANRAMSSILGQRPESLVGEDILAGIHPADGPILRVAVGEVSRGAATGANTVRFRNPDGFWKRCYLLPSIVGIQSGDQCVMLRALSAGEIEGRFDPLAGVMDHQAFVERLERVFHRGLGEGEAPFALLHLGFTNLTAINIELGWSVGNEVLRSSGQRLSLHLRPSDVVSRVSGEEFHVVLERLRSPEDGFLVAERMVEFLNQPFTVAGQEVTVQVSIGVVPSNLEYHQAADMIADAERAFMAAKYESDSAIVVHSREGGEAGS